MDYGYGTSDRVKSPAISHRIWLKPGLPVKVCWFHLPGKFTHTGYLKEKSMISLKDIEPLCRRNERIVNRNGKYISKDFKIKNFMHPRAFVRDTYIPSSIRDREDVYIPFRVCILFYGDVYSVLYGLAAAHQCEDKDW